MDNGCCPLHHHTKHRSPTTTAQNIHLTTPIGQIKAKYILWSTGYYYGQQVIMQTMNKIMFLLISLFILITYLLGEFIMYIDLLTIVYI